MNNTKVVYRVWQWLTWGMLVYLLAYATTKAAELGWALNVIELSWLSLSLVLLGKFVLTLLNGIKFKVLINLFDIDLLFKEWFGLTLVVTFSSYFGIGQVGHLPRAHYLKNRYKLIYSDYLVSMAGLNFIHIITVCLLGILILSLNLYFYEKGTNLSSELYMAFLAGFFLCFAAGISLVAIVFTKKLPPILWLRKVESKLKQGILKLREKPKILSVFFLLNFISILGRATALWGCFVALGCDVVYSDIVLIECALSVASLISITPANIGIAEGVVVSLGVVLGIPPFQSMVAAILSRLLSMCIHLPLGLYFSQLLFAKKVV